MTRLFPDRLLIKLFTRNDAKKGRRARMRDLTPAAVAPGQDQSDRDAIPAFQRTNYAALC